MDRQILINIFYPSIYTFVKAPHALFQLTVFITVKPTESDLFFPITFVIHISCELNITALYAGDYPMIARWY